MDQEQAREVAMQLLTVAEAIAPSMPRVADLMDSASELIIDLIRRVFPE